jgi:hypothetical protein
VLQGQSFLEISSEIDDIHSHLAQMETAVMAQPNSSNVPNGVVDEVSDMIGNEWFRRFLLLFCHEYLIFGVCEMLLKSRDFTSRVAILEILTFIYPTPFQLLEQNSAAVAFLQSQQSQFGLSGSHSYTAPPAYPASSIDARDKTMFPGSYAAPAMSPVVSALLGTI